MALPLAVTVGSCTRHGEEPMSRTHLFWNATGVDSEGFTFFKSVYQKAAFEVDLAKHVQSSPASAEAKKVAAGVVQTYEPQLTELEELATSLHVILPDPSQPEFAVPSHFVADSTGSFDSEGYIAHAQHEQAEIVEQYNRASRNTVKGLRSYAAEKLPAVKEVYVLAGGQEEHGAHH